MQDIVIRPARATDMTGVLALYRVCVAEGAGMFEDRCDTGAMARQLTYLLDDGAPCLVAVHATGIIGYAYAGRYQPGAGFAHCVQSSIWIDPAHRGQGLGWALLRDFMIACRGAGYRQMVAYLRADAEPALSLHASLGFTVIGWHRDACQAFGVSHDVVSMRRVLDRIGPASEAPLAVPHRPLVARKAHGAGVPGMRGLAARLSVPSEAG